MRIKWEQKKIGEILQLEYGKPLPASDRIPAGAFPVYGANGEKDRTDKFLCDKPSIVVGRKGSAGELKITAGKFWPLDVTYYAVFNQSKYDLKFLYYVLLTLDLPTLARGVKPGINRNDVYALTAMIPPLSEQQRIVRLLDEALEGIDIAKANTEQNLQNTRELFESQLNAVFEQKNDEWKTEKIRDVCELVNGRQYSKQELLSTGKYRVLRVGNFFTSTTWYYSDLELEEQKYCNSGDLLYAWSASFGPRMWAGGKVIFHYHIWKVVHDTTQIDKKYLFYFFQWDTEKIKKAQGTGTTMMHVSMGSMNERAVVVPPLADQLRMVRVLDDFNTDTSNLVKLFEKKIVAMDQLKESLLRKAFHAGDLVTA
jgi:type I restriction enzyme S subunit